MNEALRLLKRALNCFGYDVRKIHDYDFMNVRNIDSLERSHSLETLKKAFYSDKALIDPTEISRLCIYVRTYIPGDPNAASGRITKASTHDNVLVCVASLVDSVNYAVERLGSESVNIVVLDDHSDETSLQAIKQLLDGARCKWSFKTTKSTGQGPTAFEQFESARGQHCLVYFCEDDYLHLETAIYEMWEFYKMIFLVTGSHMVLYPADSPYYYMHHYPSYIVLGDNRHWRSMSHITATFFTHSMFLAKYWDYFADTKYIGHRRKRGRASEAKTINRLFKHIPGFSPIPSLTCHLQSSHTLSPFFDWRKLWSKYKSDELP